MELAQDHGAQLGLPQGSRQAAGPGSGTSVPGAWDCSPSLMHLSLGLVHLISPWIIVQVLSAGPCRAPESLGTLQ